MKPFTAVAIAVFSVVAALQSLRIILQWQITVEGFFIPFWASALACLAAAVLAVMLWREART